MDYARAIRIILPVGLFLATFLVTLRLSGDAGEHGADVPQAGSPEAAMPVTAIEAVPEPVEAPQDLLLSTGELDDATWAITTLADAPSPESIEALQQVLASSRDPRERLAAVDALQRIAASGVWNGAARAALRQAAGDQDAEVATRARSALAGG